MSSTGAHPEAIAQTQKRVARIRESIDIVEVLDHYGYRVQLGGGDREQQFPCDLHGDGLDGTPSARSYGDHWHCWGCGKSRDAIDLVQIKENVTFAQACTVLEKRYELPQLPWVDYKYEPLPTVVDDLNGIFNREDTFEEWTTRLSSLLMPLSHDRVLSLEQTMRFWESFDKVSYLVRRNDLTEPQGSKALARLRGLVLEALKQGTH